MIFNYTKLGKAHLTPPGHRALDHHASHDYPNNRAALLHSPDEHHCVVCGGSPLLWDPSTYRPYTLTPWRITEEP